MGQNSKIQWCAHTFNGVIGCTEDQDSPDEMSPECANCYAREGQNHRVSKAKGLPLWGAESYRQVTSVEYWKQPLRWNKEAKEAGERRRVFAFSLGDVFEEFHGPLVGNDGSFVTLDDVRQRLWQLIEQTPYLDWLLLTKRPQNVRRMVHSTGWLQNDGKEWPNNVWVGTTAGTQRGANRRIPWLLEIPAPVRFVSYEPAIEAVDWTRLEVVKPQPPNGPGVWLNSLNGHVVGPDDIIPHHIDWLIVGGESGRNARSFDIAWARKAVVQCKEAKIPVFMKQLGSCPIGISLNDKKGGDPSEWPEDLRVREIPKAATDNAES